MRSLESGSVTFKAVLIGVIVLLLLIPLAMLKSIVTERAGLREQAYQRVAEGWGGELTVGGPMLIVPTERIVKIDGKETLLRSEVYLLPAKLNADMDVKLDPEPRYVGIYAVPVYLSTLRLQGEFDFTTFQSLVPESSPESGIRFLWSQSRLRLPLNSVGSLREIKQAGFAGQQVKLGPAAAGAHLRASRPHVLLSGTDQLPMSRVQSGLPLREGAPMPTLATEAFSLFQGIEARVDLSELHQTPGTTFDFNAVIAGSRAVSILPLGSVTSVKLSSDWPHPSFQGSSLPVERTISDAGFQARWQVLELNRAYGEIWREGDVTEEMLRRSAVGVSLFQPVDIYQRGERAVKYAVLFIALTFLTFFAWEQVTRNRLHPLQYLLVGLALSMFYLLLIALSEHIAFALAYIAAAGALVLLIGSYLAGALRSARRGVIAGAAMSLVYGLLYMLVLSENYSLLLGSIILFAALAGVMLATRRVDWYRLTPQEPSRTEGSHP